MNIYFRDVLMGFGEHMVDVSCSKGVLFEDYWRYTPTAGDAGSTPLTIQVFTPDREILITSTTSTLITRPLSYPAAPAIRKLLVIGNSTVSNGIMLSEMVRLLDGDTQFSLELVGSNNGAALDSTGASRSVASEAISGWSIELFNTSENTPWTQLNGTPRIGSPFLVGGVFNFSGYLSNYSFSLSENDWVFINMGINEVFNEATDAQMEIKTALLVDILNEWIDSIKSAVPGIRIGIALIIAPSSSQDSFGSTYGNIAQNQRRYRRNRDLWVKKTLETWDAITQPNVFIIPLNAVVDTVNNVKTISVPFNARNSSTYNQQNDSVHPDAKGYYQLSDTMVSYLKGSG